RLVQHSEIIRPSMVLADESDGQLQYMVMSDASGSGIHHLQQTPQQQQQQAIYNPISYGSLSRKRSEPRIPRNFYQANTAAAASGQPSGEFRGCNCNKSHCLKLYCECFSEGQLCHNCNCNGCMNNLDFEQGCKNTEESVHRRCLNKFMEATNKTAPPETGYRRNERPTDNTVADFLTKPVLEGVASCLVNRADLADKAEDLPAAQERAILQEFGDCLQQAIEGAASSRPVTAGAMSGSHHVSSFHHHRQSDIGGAGSSSAAAATAAVTSGLPVGASGPGGSGASLGLQQQSLDFGGHMKSEQVVIVDVI
uniref:CRC domain-containing protein n=1 Tax=Macrostomum lignano TaxID=282301 RepID=A0A1I8FYW0_9PLAT